MHCANIHHATRLLVVSLTPQTKQEATARLAAVRPRGATGQVRDVGISCQHLRNVLLCLDSSDHDQTIATLCHCL